MGQNESAYVDPQGRLVLPPNLAARYGIKPGTQVSLDESAMGLHLRRPASQLAKLYIEPTNRCNLDCRTCIRNVWDEPLGMMPTPVFARMMEGLHHFLPPPAIFFGGFGEPLVHPQIVEMVAQAKGLGTSVELITNGMLLKEELARELVRAGLDRLWVSLDGATPESYADVRLGAALPQVIENVKRFDHARRTVTERTVQIGIAFVAMKSNIADLPSILRLGRDVGASHFSVSNLLPYTDTMQNQVLYDRVLGDTLISASVWTPHLNLPKMDMCDETRESLDWVMRNQVDAFWLGANSGGASNRCPFVESGSGAIKWNGDLSPCLPLLHTHVSFLYGREHTTCHWTIGNVMEQELSDLWHLPEHTAFRERVQNFSFAPCTVCGGCELFEKNEEDCFGQTFPTCGGCLWAQGVIQCP